MTTASFFTAMLRRSLRQFPDFLTCRTLPFALIDHSRALSSSIAPQNERIGFPLDVDVELRSSPSAAPDDLRSRIFRLRFPKRSATAAIEKWIAEGGKATAPELRQIARDLRRSQRYKHALEISEWMKSHQEAELSEGDYAMRIDLITKVFGVSSAEDFFEGLPSMAKSCEAYTALLHSYAGVKLIEKAERLFERILDSNFCVSILTFNEMMTLYASIGQLDKIHAVIEEIKRRKISPDLFTYNLWISATAAALDIEGAQRILKEMASDSSSDSGWATYMRLADIYITAGHFVSSDSSLVDAENAVSPREWITYDFLILLHAGLGNIQKINEIWKALHTTPQKMTSRNYMCVLSSYLVLGKFNEAGEIFDEWMQSKLLDFDISACNRLFDAFLKAGLMESAETFRGLILQKNCEIADSTTKSPI